MRDKEIRFVTFLLFVLTLISGTEGVSAQDPGNLRGIKEFDLTVEQVTLNGQRVGLNTDEIRGFAAALAKSNGIPIRETPRNVDFKQLVKRPTIKITVHDQIHAADDLYIAVLNLLVVQNATGENGEKKVFVSYVLDGLLKTSLTGQKPVKIDVGDALRVMFNQFRQDYKRLN